MSWVLKYIPIETLVSFLLINVLGSMITRNESVEALARAFTIPERDVNTFCKQVGITSPEGIALILADFRSLGTNIATSINKILSDIVAYKMK